MSDQSAADAPGPLIGAGRAADVYDVGDGRVLRRNRDGTSTEAEALVMRHLHRHGYPVPQVHDSNGPDLVMDKIDGDTMLDLFPRRPWKAGEWARILADLHSQLEQVPIDGLELAAPFGQPEVLIHGDLHPDNVMLAPSGPVVIDWPNARLGPRGFDAAHTWVLMATSEVDAPVPKWIMSAGRRYFIRRFLAGVNQRDVEANVECAANHRLGDRNLLPNEPEAIRDFLASHGPQRFS